VPCLSARTYDHHGGQSNDRRANLLKLLHFSSTLTTNEKVVPTHDRVK
jgi:hypothetical protein